MYQLYYASEIGVLEITADDTHIYTCSFVEEKGVDHPNECLRICEKQLHEYFLGQRKTFDLPLQPKGTPFQERVWKALETIPYGETCSYKDIAIKCGNDKASRAIGMANNKNPIALIIPCHRVIGASGKLVGYGGGLDKKIYLLEHEQKFK